MKVYVDYDSTLNNLGEAWLAWCNNRFNTNYTYLDVTDWYWFNNVFPKEAFEYFKVTYEIDNKYAAKPIEGSKDFFYSLKYSYDTKILTSTHKNKELRTIKNNHIKHYYNEDKVIHEHYKYKYADKSSVLIDDRIHNIMSWVLNGGIGILYNHNNTYLYNEDLQHLVNDRMFEVYNYKEALELLEEIENEQGS